MSDRKMDAEPTHVIPPDLERALVRGRDWYARRVELDNTIRTYGGIADRNQADRDENDREAASILEEIVEVVERTWGYA